MEVCNYTNNYTNINWSMGIWFINQQQPKQIWIIKR